MNAFAHLPADEPLRETLDPGIWVEPKDKDATAEVTRQSALVNVLRKHSRCVVFAVPNAARSESAKLRQHREGAVYGAADLVITWAGGVAFVEMKDGKSMPRDNQVAFLNRLKRQDHHVAVCRTPMGAMRWLRAIGAPVGGVRA
jgi:hypothetical protein